jgi:phage baseplate assembly protein W
MAVKIKQYYDIKFPFTANNENGMFIDLNGSVVDKVSSQIAHLILTQKGTRLRMPNFGTDLLKYVFSPNDNISWSAVESEIRTAVGIYVPSASIKSVGVTMGDSDNDVMVDVKYSVTTGKESEDYRMAIKL